MKPIITETTNDILKAPNSDENISDLPITRLKFSDGTPVVQSCWELTEEELKTINQTKRIYFSTLGNTHPPISLDVNSEIE